MRRRFSRLLKFIGFLAIIIVGLTVFCEIKMTLDRRKTVKYYNNTLAAEYKSLGMDSFEDRLSKERSDIAGWTKLDKFKAGLNPDDGSDTDNDGLTDRQEIEIYGSDPLKRSTAGDLYTDGQKAERGIEVKAYVPYEGVVELKENECPEVKFTVKTADDLQASARDRTQTARDPDMSWLYPWASDYEIYKVYLIDSYFRDSLSIDTSSLDLPQKTVVLAGKLSSVLEKADHSEEGSLVTISHKFEGGDVVAFVRKKSLFSFGSSAIKTDSGSYREPKAMIVDLAFLCAMPFHKGKVYYVNGTDEAENELMKAEMRNAVYYMCYREAEIDFQEISTAQYNRKLSFLRRYFPAREFSPYTDLLMDPVFAVQSLSLHYFTYDTIKGYRLDPRPSFMPEIPPLPPKAPHASDVMALGDGKMLDIGGATLPFFNFGSYISPGGNCAGISHLTCLLYNTGSNHRNGSYYIDGIGAVDWDLTTDPENTTLTDPGLSDYKTGSFTLDHISDISKGIVIDEGLTPGEQEFVKMTGCFWAEGNERSREGDYIKFHGRTNNSYALINKMKRCIDEGRMLDLYIGCAIGLEGSGHAINVVGYRDTTGPEGEQMTYFYVYDNNYPGNRTPGGSPVDNRVMVMRTEPKYGYPESFSWYYHPVPECDIMTDLLSDRYEFTVFDENWKSLNDQVALENPLFTPYGE